MIKKPFSIQDSCKNVVFACGLLLIAACSSEPDSDEKAAAEPEASSDAVNGSPEVGYPTQVYFGDTHLHSSNSGDAFAYGARLTPDHAYRFAKGEEVTSSTGQQAKLSRPLDFLVVADHAEGLGVMQGMLDGNEELLRDPQMVRWTEMMNKGGKSAHQATQEIIRGLADGTLPDVISDPVKSAPFARSIWSRYVEAADRHYQPGVFTPLIGYEFSSQPKGDNLHRVVVFRDGADKAGSVLPFSSTVSEDPEDLWRALLRYEETTGGRVLAIPHNPNLSNGRMFSLSNFEGLAIDADYARQRARWEPLVEATQIKGDSESHPFLSPNDEYAGYGDSGWEQGNLTLQTAKTNEMLKGDYVREGLKRGLIIDQRVGANPFKFGMIGSTDSHTGLATGDENNFFGKNRQMEPSEKRVSKVYKKAEAGAIFGWQYLAGGYAAVWAKENTRESLFDAMIRKEVYTTTGPRIRLRFFAGFEFTEEMLDEPDMVRSAYTSGVPMGGNLNVSTNNQTPRFLIKAMKDPDGSNLALLQIIKGWVKKDGAAGEYVYDILASRQVEGSSELSAYWQDPDFDPVQNAFYYVRALEVPSVRWPVYDSERYRLDLPEEAREMVQERAYSSPIWYNAGKLNKN